MTFPWIALEERMKITSLAVILKVCITTAFFKKSLSLFFMHTIWTRGIVKKLEKSTQTCTPVQLFFSNAFAKVLVADIIL